MSKKNYQKSFNIIVAADKNRCIGGDNKLLWHIPEDMKHFVHITTTTHNPQKQNAVIMGRKTWESLPYKPLKNRKNIIISRSTFHYKNTKIFQDIESAINYCNNNSDIESTYVIGGGEIYRQTINHPKLENIYLTEIDASFPKGDTYFPIISPEHFTLMENRQSQNDKWSYTFKKYTRRNQDEEQYLELVARIIHEGIPRKDRTNIGTLSLFAERLEFNLEHSFPLLTTKKMFWKGVVEELLWFISGSTDAKQLQKRGVRIWNANSSREFLDKRGLTEYREGDIGAGYGFQWRHFGAEYKGCDEDYTDQGVDQLKKIIDEIKKNPTSRRLYMSAWNPKDEPKMSLPPCHLGVQFYIDNDKGLYCQMYQRSADSFLGLPFNIASYALLTKMIAHVTGLKAKKLIICLGDTHIYQNHIDQCKKQLHRQPYRFPYVILNSEIKNIDQFTSSDIQLKDYYCHPPIKASMAI